MLRFLSGVGSTLLLVAAGFFIWKSQAETDNPIPPVPAAAGTSPSAQSIVEAPPSAPELTKEQRRFGRADKNDDGRITRDELMQPRLKAFGRLDKNGDSRLSFEEWAVKTAERFSRADSDRNGALNPAEYATTKAKAKARPQRCDC